MRFSNERTKRSKTSQSAGTSYRVTLDIKVSGRQSCEATEIIWGDGQHWRNRKQHKSINWRTHTKIGMPRSMIKHSRRSEKSIRRSSMRRVSHHSGSGCVRWISHKVYFVQGRSDGGDSASWDLTVSNAGLAPASRGAREGALAVVNQVIGSSGCVRG